MTDEIDGVKLTPGDRILIQGQMRRTIWQWLRRKPRREPTNGIYSITASAGPTPMQGLCCVTWGSHGCDLGRGHEGDIHECGVEEGHFEVHSQYNSATKQRRDREYETDDPEEKGEWSEWFSVSHE